MAEALAAKLSIQTTVQQAPSGEPVLEADDERIYYVCQQVTFILGEGTDAGAGTLYITTK